MKLTAEERWLPASIGYTLSEPVIELVQLSGPLKPFFSDLDLRNPARSTRLPLMDLELPPEPSNLSPAGLIFHLPRSGSTLVARMLSTPEASASIVEPEAINALLSDPTRERDFDPAWLRQLVGIYCLAFATAFTHLFVKLSSWGILQEPLFARAFPAVPTCFVYRNPAEVMVQVLQRPTGWMADHARPFILGTRAPSSMSLEEYCAEGLKRFCEAAGRSRSRMLAVSYPNLPDAVPDLLARHLGLHLTAADRRAMRRVAQFDSEDWSGRRLFAQDSESLRRRATPEITRLANCEVQPSLQRWLEPLPHV